MKVHTFLLFYALIVVLCVHISVDGFNDDEEDDYYFEENEPTADPTAGNVVDCNLPSALDFEECTQEALWARSILPHSLAHVPLARPLPRISTEALRLRDNEGYRPRRKPFILTGAMEGWGALKNWPLDTKQPAGQQYLPRLFPQEVCDFYPYNMLESGSKPFLIRNKSGVDEVLHPPGRFAPPKSKVACYIETGGERRKEEKQDEDDDDKEEEEEEGGGLKE
jgi:hypothetical protein